MLKYFPQLKLKEGDAKPFLEEIWKRSYLLRQISLDSYDFLHLSFQEYFTALELKAQEEGISTIIEHLSESWWEEPILLFNSYCRFYLRPIKDLYRFSPFSFAHYQLSEITDSLCLFSRWESCKEHLKMVRFREILDPSRKRS